MKRHDVVSQMLPNLVEIERMKENDKKSYEVDLDDNAIRGRTKRTFLRQIEQV
jgi:hypothetical protein